MIRKQISIITTLLVTLVALPLAAQAVTTSAEDMRYAIGESEDDNAGSGIARLGDINNDGYDDFGVGAPAYSGSKGVIYVVYGRSKKFNALELANRTRLRGESDNDQVGYYMAAAGDINNDGYDDFLVGAPFTDDGENKTGTVYIVYGQADELENQSLENFVQYTGNGERNEIGSALAGIGDINADGYDDIAIGAQRLGDNRSGKTFIIYGQAEALAGGDIESIENYFLGEADYDRSGAAVATAGDMTGDGIDDFVIGAPGSDDVDSNAGKVYLIPGRASLYVQENLADVDVTFTGYEEDGKAGSQLAGGDINGDGNGDIIVGSYQSSIQEDDAGSIFLIYGSDSTNSSSLENAVRFYSEKINDLAGYSLDGYQDVNADGYDDFVIGAPGDNTGRQGIAVVIYGKSDELSGGNIRNYDVYKGQLRDERLGTSVALADLNGDGKADLITGAPEHSATFDKAGIAYIAYIPILNCDNSAAYGGIMADYPESDWKHRKYAKNKNLRIVVERKGKYAYLVNCVTDEIEQTMKFNSRVQRKILARVFSKHNNPMFVVVTRTPNNRKIKIYLYKQKKNKLERTDFIKRSWRPRGLRINVNSYRREVRLYKGAEKKHTVIYRVDENFDLEKITDN